MSWLVESVMGWVQSLPSPLGVVQGWWGDARQGSSQHQRFSVADLLGGTQRHTEPAKDLLTNRTQVKMTRKLFLSFSLLLWVAGTTSGQRRPPNYSQDMMPATSFSCRDKIIGGYYADPETDCQMFHICVKVPGQGIQDYRFLCPNGTSFDQENQICDDWFNIDCEAATLFYSDNFDLYRIGSDFPRLNQEPRLPSNNINNAVSDNDDDFYLQKSDRGENVGSDLLRGSHSSNYFSNKNRGREDDDDVKEDYRSKNSNKNGVKKLLTGKRPIATTSAPAVSYSTASQYQPRTHNNYNAGRSSQFRGHQRNQQSSTSTEAPTRQTETYNRQPFHQRNFYSPTTPKVETTPSTQKAEFFNNYNPTTKRSFYENTQNYNAQTTTNFPQTTRNYQNFRITTTTQPTTVFYETTVSSERNNFYETQKLFQLNTGGVVNQYDDSKDEFLKTAPSQNLGASAFNSLQNSYKNFNTSVSASYNFNPTVKPTTINFQTQTYFTPTTQPPNFYTQSTVQPYQQQNYYTTPKVQPSQQTYQQNYYNPAVQASSTTKPVPQYTPTTLRPFQQTYTQPTTTFQQYNPTTLKPYQQQYNQETNKPFQQQYNNPLPKQNYQPQSSAQPTTNFQLQRNTGSPQTYQQNTQNGAKQYQQPSRAPSQFQQTSTYYTTTIRPYQPVQTTITSRGKGTFDATERPKPFTQNVKKDENNKKEKDQYDYAYYDDGTQSEYDTIEPVEEFKRTKSKN